MFGMKASSRDGATADIAALGRSLAIIEFDPSGKILTANENFCRALGYTLTEIQGRHHSMFVDPKLAGSADYKVFWAKLGRGEFDAREYKRIGKGGREVWIQASYNPVINAKGAVVKVIKQATVVTAEKLRNVEFEETINAILRVQAMIAFTPSGEIITANENFLNTLGYRLDEIKGKHHRMFVEPAYGQSIEYQEFWAKLNRGEFINASFKRIGKGGKEVWIQGSYNPILDLNGKVMKVVKFANDITDLTEIGAGLARLADKNLEQRIEKPFMPAFEKLRVDFNLAHDNLRITLKQITDSAAVIASGSEQITSASDDLSSRTEQQASTLEETAAALEEITATVSKSAEGANHARGVVTAANADATEGALVMRQAVEAMDAIAKSAGQISQIIGVIDEIAFQTNLLALNAGVEAARAGDAGRGFAVVASEVRALAQRSAEAAKEIKGLISTSSMQVQNGVKLVAETGASLERIMTQVADINNVVVGIASGAKEQATGLAEVNSAVTRMDQVTQQNAVMVEQATAASHSLAKQANDLLALISAFRFARDHGEVMRTELKKVAPHAFRPSAKAPKAPPARLAAAKPVTRHAQPAPKARVVHGGPSQNSADWSEF